MTSLPTKPNSGLQATSPLPSASTALTATNASQSATTNSALTTTSQAPGWDMYTAPVAAAVFPRAKTMPPGAQKEMVLRPSAEPSSSQALAKSSSLNLVILGEAPGADEERYGQPFIGSSGKTLREWMFPKSGLNVDQWHILNTFLKRPPNNDLKNWTATKTDAKKEGWTPVEPALRKRYIRPEHYWQLAELDQRLRTLKPDLIVAMGGTALWALTGEAAIQSYRGNFFWCERYQCWAIATYHPAALLYQWSNMPYAWADLTKVKLWLEGDLPAPLHRRFCINPTFAEIEQVYNTFKANPSWVLGVDIETSPKLAQITTISYSSDVYGICIPIWDKYAKPGTDPNFWKTPEDELRAWYWIRRFAALPNPKVWQNGLYDSQYLLDAPLEIRVLHASDDTAILQHSLQPEMQKALGTLASLYLNEPAWKFMRTQDKDVNKADD